MADERGERVKRLVAAAQELDPREQAAFLTGLAEPNFRKRVESLLNDASPDHGAPDSESLTVDESTAIKPLTPDTSAPDRIGPYHILREIGEGGMGVVYEAEQEKPVRRKVALKLIKWGMDTKAVVARFESERQALALMNHPNIASVHDAGATDEGRPYFAMEYVQGVPITEYCDKHRLRLEERLDLFMRVCEGVQHAHQKGIIHRDIKPSNVLVAVQDDKPVPKIIDFGVAKATSQRLTERTVATELGQLIGTPEYMSPEQAEMSNLDIDTRTDVYSLGVLLYELLAGAQPFDPKSLRVAGLVEIQRKLREDEPPRPSTRVSDLGHASSTWASNRRVDVRTLARQLKGDLDWITMKAIEKDRTRRYETPHALATDLRRYLENEPIRARSPSPLYRAGRFVRRHRVGVAAVTGFAILLIGFAALTLVQSARIAQERDRAEQEAAKARAVNEFLADMLSAADPSREGREVRVVEVLDRATDRVSASFSTQPEVEASVRQTLGETMVALGQYDTARVQLDASLRIRRSTLGEEHPDTLIAMNNLAEAMYFQGQHAQAEEQGRQTLAIRARVLGDEHKDTLVSASNLGAFLNAQGKFDEAEQTYRSLVERSERLLGEADDVTLQSRNNLAYSLKKQEKYEEAESIYRYTLDVRRRVFGEDDPVTLITATNLAQLLTDDKRASEAEPLLRDVLERKMRVLGGEHPDTLVTLNSLGLVLCGQEKYDEALSVYRQLTTSADEVLSDSDRRRHIYRAHSAACLAQTGRFEEAEPVLRNAYLGLLEISGAAHPQTEKALESLIELYDGWGMPDKAAEYRARVEQAQPR